MKFWAAMALVADVGSLYAGLIRWSAGAYLSVFFSFVTISKRIIESYINIVLPFRKQLVQSQIEIACVPLAASVRVSWLCL